VGRGVDLVVDVGDVAGVDDLGVAEPQQAEEDVEDDHRPGVADVDVVVDRGAADVHRHPGGVERLEAALVLRERVVQE